MGLLNPILGNTRQEILTPEEQNKIGSSGASVIGQTYDLDGSKYNNVNLDLAITGGLESVNEARAKSQSGLQLLGKGVGNIVGTALFELGKLPGYAVGAGMAVAQQDITPMIDNDYLNGVKAIQEATQEKWFEVYTPKAIQEGGALKQLSNPYFWASEGANGVGFLLSFLVPGQVIKAFGIGAKAVGGLAKAGKLSEVIADGSKIVKGGNEFGKVMLKTLGKSGRALDFGKLASQIDSGVAVAANTMFESAAESSELYEQMLGEGSTKEEASLAAAQAFKMNVGLLAVSNFLVEKYLFDGFGKSLVKPRQITSEVIKGNKQIAESLLNASARKMPLAVASGVLQEGVFEEGLQTTIQQTKGGNITDVLEKYMENLQDLFGDDPESVEFTKSVVLGGVLGAGMGTVGGVNEARRENRFLFGEKEYTPGKIAKFIGFKAREATVGGADLLRNSYKAMKRDKSDLYEFDSTGKIIGFAANVKEKLTDASNLEVLSNYYNDKLLQNNGDIAQTNSQFVDELRQAGATPQDAVAFAKIVQAPKSLSNQEAIAYVQHQGHKRYLDNFMQMEGGAQMAEAHLEDQLEAARDRYEGNTGVKMTEAQVSELRATLQQELKQSQELHDFIQVDHSQQRIGFNPIVEGEPDPEKTLGKYTSFFNRAKAARLELLRDIEYFRGRAEKSADEAEKKMMEGVVEEMETRYNELSSRNNLKLMWDKWNGNEVKEEAAKEVEKTVAPPAPKVEITKDGFWADVAAAGYNVVDNDDGTRSLKDDINVSVIGKNGRRRIIAATKDDKGKVKLSLIDPKNPKRVQLFDNLRAVAEHLGGSMTIVPREQIIKEREEAKRSDERLKAMELERETRVAMEDRIAELSKLDQIIERDLNNVNTQIDEAMAKAKGLKKITDPEAKALLAEVKKQIADLKKVKESLEAKRKVLQAQLDTLTEYAKLMKTSAISQIQAEEEMLQLDYNEMAPSLLAEYKDYSLEALSDAINELDTLILEIDTRIEEYQRVQAVLEEFFQRHETNVSALDRDYTQEFRQKYSYVSATKKVKGPDGTLVPERIYPPVMDKQVEKMARGELGSRVDTHLKRVALQTGQDTEKLRLEFIEDAKNLKTTQFILSKIPAPVKEELLAESLKEFARELQEEIKKGEAFRESAQMAKTMAEAVQRVKAFQSARAALGTSFRKNQKKKFLRNPDPAQRVDEGDAGDNTYVPGKITEEDPFWNHALPSELFGSTGLNILYTRDGMDMLEQDGDKYRPVANPNKYQKAYFMWLDNNSNQNFQVEARVAYYDERDGSMQEAFAENNPSDRRPGEDIFVVILDKKGKVIESDGVPLFTAMRRVETKFPAGKQPKMNIYSLMQQYIADGLQLKEGVTRETMRSNLVAKRALGVRSREAIAKALGVSQKEVDDATMAEVFSKLEALAINWGRNQYSNYLETIKQSVNAGKRVMLPVTGITKGHPVRVLDANGDIITYPLMQSLGLELHTNGRPKNFTIHKANYKGQITQGNSVVGGYVPGTVYVKMKGKDNLIPIINDKLNDNEIDLVLFILAKAAGTFSLQGTAGVTIPAEYPEGMNMKINNQVYGPGAQEVKLFPQVADKFSVINQLMMWGSNGVKSNHDIFIREGILFFGDASYNMTQIAKAVNFETGEIDRGALAPLIKFLQGRKSHISYSILDAAQAEGGKYYHPTLKGNKIVFEEHASYLDWIFSRTRSDLVPRSVIEKFGLPQLAQRNLQFGSIAPKSEPTKKEAKTKPNAAARKSPVETSVPAPQAKADLKTRLVYGATEKGEAELLDQGKALGMTDDDVLGAYDGYTAEHIAQIESMALVPKDADKASAMAKVARRGKVIKLARTLSVIEAIEAYQKAPGKVATDVSTETEESVSSPGPVIGTSETGGLTPAEKIARLKDKAKGTAIGGSKRGFGAKNNPTVLNEPTPTGVFTPALQETRRLYTADKVYYSWDVSGDEAWSSLERQGVTPEDIYNIKEEVGGKLFQYLARAYEHKTGKKLTQKPEFGADQILSTTDLLNNLVADNTIEQKCD